MNLKGKSFLKLLDFTPEEIKGLIDFAAELKQQKKAPETVLADAEPISGLGACPGSHQISPAAISFA